jgi:hypothetical protein
VSRQIAGPFNIALQLTVWSTFDRPHFLSYQPEVNLVKLGRDIIVLLPLVKTLSNLFYLAAAVLTHGEKQLPYLTFWPYQVTPDVRGPLEFQPLSRRFVQPLAGSTGGFGQRDVALFYPGNTE